MYNPNPVVPTGEMKPLLIGKSLRKSWHFVKGAKGTIWLAFLLGIAVFAVFAMVLPIFPVPLWHWDASSTLLFKLEIALVVFAALVAIVVLANTAALVMELGIQRAQGTKISLRDGISHLSRWLKITVAFLIFPIVLTLCFYVCNGIVSLLSWIFPTLNSWVYTYTAISNGIIYSVPIYPLLIIVRSVVYLVVFPLLYFIFPLVVDRDFSLRLAIMVSASHGLANWGRIILFFITLYIIYVAVFMLFFVPYVGLILLPLAMVWFVPFMTISYGMLYHRIMDKKAEAVLE